MPLFSRLVIAIRQIGEAVSISSTSVVNYNLNKLERDGYILRDLKVSRGVRLADGVGRKVSRKLDNVSIPLAGFICPPTPLGACRRQCPRCLARQLVRVEIVDYACAVPSESI